MTLAITANIILATIIFAVIVGMLAWAIRTSSPERQARPVRHARPATRYALATSRAAQARGGRSRAYGSFERMQA